MFVLHAEHNFFSAIREPISCNLSVQDCLLSDDLARITVVVLYSLCWRTSSGWLQLLISIGHYLSFCKLIIFLSQVYTFFETLLDILVLLPSFIIFFQDESRRSNSASDIAILFLAFGKPHPWKHEAYIKVVSFYLPLLVCFHCSS